MNRFLVVQQLLLLFAAAVQASASGLRSLTTESGTVTKLRLIDADTNQPVAGYDPLSPYTVIDVSSLPSSIKNFNVEAIATGAVGSVQWNDAGRIRNDDFAFWSMCGNSGSDFFACERLKVGANHTIKATPYTGKNASGTMGATVTIQLAFVQSKTVPPTLTLVNSETDRDIGPLLPDTVIDMAKTPKINVRADPNPAAATKSVQFSLNGRIYRNDNLAPYALNGNWGTNYYDWTPTAGRYNITASTFSERDAKGMLIATATVSVTVISSPQPPSPKAPVPAPTKAPMAQAPVPVVVPTPRALPTAAPIVKPAPVAIDPTSAPVTRDLRPQLVGLKLVNNKTTVDVGDWFASTFSITVEVTIIHNYWTLDSSNSSVRAFRQGKAGEGSAEIYGRLRPLSAFPGTGIPHIMRAELTFPKDNIPFGAYNLSVELKDFGSERKYDAAALANENFPSVVSVINSRNDSKQDAIENMYVSFRFDEGMQVEFSRRNERYKVRFFEQRESGDVFFPDFDGTARSKVFPYADYPLGANITFGLMFTDASRFVTDKVVTFWLRSQDLLAMGYPGWIELPKALATNDTKPRILSMTLMRDTGSGNALSPVASPVVVDLASGPVSLIVDMKVVARLQPVCYWLYYGRYYYQCHNGTDFKVEATCQGPVGTGTAKIAGVATFPGGEPQDYAPTTVYANLTFPPNKMPAPSKCNLTMWVTDMDARSLWYRVFFDTAALAQQKLTSTFRLTNSRNSTATVLVTNVAISADRTVTVVCPRSLQVSDLKVLPYTIDGRVYYAGDPSYTKPYNTKVDDGDVTTFTIGFPSFEGWGPNIVIGLQLVHGEPNVETTYTTSDLKALGFPTVF